MPHEPHFSFIENSVSAACSAIAALAAIGAIFVLCIGMGMGT